MLALLIAADQTGTPLDPGLYGQWGAAGLFIAALFVVARAVYTDIKGQRDKAESEVARLNALILDRVVPALEKSTEAHQRTERSLLEVLAEVRARRQ